MEGELLFLTAISIPSVWSTSCSKLSFEILVPLVHIHGFYLFIEKEVKCQGTSELKAVHVWLYVVFVLCHGRVKMVSAVAHPVILKSRNHSGEESEGVDVKLKWTAVRVSLCAATEWGRVLLQSSMSSCFYTGPRSLLPSLGELALLASSRHCPQIEATSALQASPWHLKLSPPWAPCPGIFPLVSFLGLQPGSTFQDVVFQILPWLTQSAAPSLSLFSCHSFKFFLQSSVFIVCPILGICICKWLHLHLTCRRQLCLLHKEIYLDCT